MDASQTRTRVGTADDWEAISELLASLFHHTTDAQSRAYEGGVFEPERSLVVVDDDRVVGHTGAYTRELTVPGGVLPAAFVTQVGVAPTHRRQGLLTAMMRRQLDDVVAAGREAVAVLWASEGRIYPRFGYGLAAQRLEFEVATREVRPPQLSPAPNARLRTVQPSAAVAELTKVYEQVRLDRPGYAGRDDRWWRYVLGDLPAHRDGATGLQAVVHETPHGPTGYALWRTRGGWTATGANAEVRVREVVAADPTAYAALWRFLLGIDLARTATFYYAALDEPLIHLVDEPRRLAARHAESLWVRLVDLPRALAGRRYAVPVDLVFEVTDGFLPANTGRWRLTGGPQGASCRRTSDAADLACTTLELGSAYLGGPSVGALAAAGRVRELTPGSVAAASAGFGWHRLPTGIEVF